MNTKYRLDKEDFKEVNGIKLFRVIALTSFSNVKIGDKGGYIESEGNLSTSGNAWISRNALVSGNDEVLWVSKIGSDLSTLTVFRTKDGYEITRGCFLGTMEEFKKAVSNKADTDESKKEYELLIPLIEHRFDKYLLENIRYD